MNGTDRLERELTTWFSDTAAPRVPDYTADIVRATATMRQRPRWSFPTRWLPAGLMPRLPHMTVRPVSWRTIALLAVLGLLLAAMLTLYLGSRPRVPPPFGPAANGLVTYAEDGDIWTVDPETGERAPIVRGDSNDRAPRFSRDGTRIAFFREVDNGVSLVVTNADGSDPVDSLGPAFTRADTDSIVWSPDGRWVAVAADFASDRTIYLIDTSTGAVRNIEAFGNDVEMYWRPPDGRQLMYVAGHAHPRHLMLLTVADGTKREIPLGDPQAEIRPGGWSVDGGRFVVHRFDDAGPWTELVHPETGEVERIEIAFGRLSNDATRIVGYRELRTRQSLCVMPVPAGPCLEIAAGSQAPEFEHAAGLQWSPDDRWIVAYPQDGKGWVLLDPEGGPPFQPGWAERGLDSWQRVAPSPWWEWW